MAGEHLTDLIVVGIIILSGLLALMRGLVREVLSIASWVGAVFVTLYGFVPARPLARDIIGWPLAADVVTGAALFLGSLFVFSLAGHVASKMVQGSTLGAVDRSLGFVFGLARGLVVVVVLYMAASWAIGERDQPSWFKNSRSVPIAAVCARLVLALVPEETRKLFPPIVQPERRRAEAPPPETPAREGYRPAARRDMERLIESGR